MLYRDDKKYILRFSKDLAENIWSDTVLKKRIEGDVVHVKVKNIPTSKME